jgi:hypothetical protein
VASVFTFVPLHAPVFAAELTDDASATPVATTTPTSSFYLSQDTLADTIVDARYVPDASLIVTDNDFSAYVAPMLRKDSNILSIATTDHSVTMDYRTPARFLGMFHSHLITEAIANEDGSISVSHPWLSILYDQNDGFDDSIRSAIEKQMGDLLNTAAPSGALTLSLKAQMLDRLHDAFEMNRDAGGA